MDEVRDLLRRLLLFFCRSVSERRASQCGVGWRTMSLACLVCHSVDSPTHSFRSYSVSSSESEGCSAMVSCLTQRMVAPRGTASSMATAKVSPAPVTVGSQGMTGTPRLVRSRAVTRDRVRDWNFDELLQEN